MFGDFNPKLAILVLYILYPNNISYNNLCVSRPSPKEIKPGDKNIQVFLTEHIFREEMERIDKKTVVGRLMSLKCLMMRATGCT